MAQAVKGVFIVGAKRTPFGAFGGALAKKTPTDLQTVAANAAIAQAGLDAKHIDSVVVGNVISASHTDTIYISRHVGLRCGVPIETPALTVNRLCGSGFQSVVTAAEEIMLGKSKVVLTGGVDNMSMAPYAARDIRFGPKIGVDFKLEDCLWASLTDAHTGTPMGVTAENLAKKYGISRGDAEAFAIRSQQNWGVAQKEGRFDAEMAPVEVKSRKGPVSMAVDEHPKPETTAEKIAKLPAVFGKGGTVTAATASGICDGAGAVLLASEEAVKEHSLTPLARVVGYACAGVEPTIMGIGPCPAIRNMLAATGVSMSEVAIVEINEAFAPQTIACQKELDLDPATLNVNGGAIALGHPLAASGSRITAHLVHELKRRGAKYGIGSACIGGGQGISVLIEAL